MVAKLADTSFIVQSRPASKAFHMTLRLKAHNITVLLSVPSTESFVSIRKLLLEALQARGVTEINGSPVTDNPEDIEFAVPVDANKLQQGWVLLEVPTETSKRGAPNATPVAAGLKDSAVLAFRFRRISENMTEEERIRLDLEDPGWDVILPSLDDEEA
ncbi:hypothetical protein KEM54_005323 [Ascosphaera aggregata]|nr:hypothetical protein KEM54_005323 [Ascosphaera aggregata]